MKCCSGKWLHTRSRGVFLLAPGGSWSPPAAEAAAPAGSPAAQRGSSAAPALPTTGRRHVLQIDSALQQPKLHCSWVFATCFPVGSSPARLKPSLRRAARLKCSDARQRRYFSDKSAFMCTGGLHVQSQAQIQFRTNWGLNPSWRRTYQPSSPTELFQWEGANQHGTQRSLYEQAGWSNTRKKPLFSFCLGHVCNFISYTAT